MGGVVSYNCVKRKDYWSDILWNDGKSKWHIATGNDSNQSSLVFFFIHLLRFVLILVACMQMYEELQVLSALVPTRQLYFLRLVQQIEAGSWAIVDVSYDIPHQESQFSSSCKAQRLPSGCLIQEMPNGYSKVVRINELPSLYVSLTA